MTARSKKLRLFLVVFLSLSFVFTASADNMTDSITDSMEWLQKDAWSDRPSYAENISIQYSATDLIQERVTREVCSGDNLINETSGQFYCNGTMENQTMPGGNAPIFDISGNSNAYLGNGHVRTNLTVGLNELSTQTLKETTFLMDESEYVNWFNQNYYYKGSNITGSEVDELQSKLTSMSAHGENTNLKATRFNSLEITSIYPFRASADTTMVFRFNDFRSGSFVLSDLVSVEVDSSIAN